MDAARELSVLTKLSVQEAQVLLDGCDGDLEAAVAVFAANSVPSTSQQFYAGGLNSGIAIEGPAHGGMDVVDSIMRQATEHSLLEPAASKRAPFAGTGVRLGHDTVQPHGSNEQPLGTSNQQPLGTSNEHGNAERVERTLTFWRLGFSLDSGPLMPYSDPANQTVLRSINSGRVPPSLFKVPLGKAVDIRVVKRMDDEYEHTVSALPAAAFAGTGTRLGSITTATPQSHTQSSTASQAIPSIQPQLNLDPTQPITSIQLRLADGTRMVVRLNHSHSVGHLARFIRA